MFPADVKIWQQTTSVKDSNVKCVMPPCAKAHSTRLFLFSHAGFAVVRAASATNTALGLGGLRSAAAAQTMCCRRS